MSFFILCVIIITIIIIFFIFIVIIKLFVIPCEIFGKVYKKKYLERNEKKIFRGKFAKKKVNGV